MSSANTARKVMRLREVERRVASAAVADVMNRLDEADSRVARLHDLARAVAVGCGLVVGSEFASGGECVGRLLAGCIATTTQRNLQGEAATRVQAAFGAADARATIAGRHLDAAQASERISAERRAALKLPVVRCR